MNKKIFLFSLVFLKILFILSVYSFLFSHLYLFPSPCDWIEVLYNTGKVKKLGWLDWFLWDDVCVWMLKLTLWANSKRTVLFRTVSHSYYLLWYSKQQQGCVVYFLWENGLLFPPCITTQPCYSMMHNTTLFVTMSLCILPLIFGFCLF